MESNRASGCQSLAGLLVISIGFPITGLPAEEIDTSISPESQNTINEIRTRVYEGCRRWQYLHDSIKPHLPENQREDFSIDSCVDKEITAYLQVRRNAFQWPEIVADCHRRNLEAAQELSSTLESIGADSSDPNLVDWDVSFADIQSCVETNIAAELKLREQFNDQREDDSPVPPSDNP